MKGKERASETNVEVDFVEVAVGMEDNVHVVKARNLAISMLASTRERMVSTNVFVTTEVVEKPGLCVN